MGDVTRNAAEVPGDYVPWFAFSIGASPGAQSIKPQNRLGGSAEARGRASGCSWSATLDCSWGSSDPTEGSRQGDGTTRYLLDGLSVVAQYAPDGQRQAWYTQSLARIDEVLNVVSDGGKQWYQADALGSVYGLTNSSGVLIGNQNYDVFGAPTPAPSGPAGQPFGFTGREHELDSGLVYARARYLNPAVGRWTRPDPIGFIQGPNRYGYVLARATGEADPYGYFGTSLHEDIIKRALRGRAPESDIQFLQSVQAFADFGKGAQDPQSAYKHAMSGEGGVIEAMGLWWDFLTFSLSVSANIERDQSCFNYGDKQHKASLTVLGLGMHALQDFFSPWHTGFQRWNPSDVAATAAHLTQEPFQKIGDPGPIQATLYTAQYYETYKSLLKLPFVDRGHAVALFGYDLYVDALFAVGGM